MLPSDFIYKGEESDDKDLDFIYFPASNVIMVLLRLVHYGRFVNLILYYRNSYDEL